MQEPSCLMPTYARQPATMVRGDGVWLYDDKDNAYLDALSGIAVCSLGHAHPAITRTIQEQAGKLLHCSNAFHIPAQEQLAEQLVKLSGLHAAFFCNSGAEANEAAIKLCRLYGHKKQITTPSIIVMDNAFHGRTLATLSASGSRKVQAGFEPLVQGFIRAPYNDIDALNTIAQNSPQVVALMVEPVQGESGVRIPDPGYLHALREVCDTHGWLLVLDEVQCGLGRTGKMFAYQHETILPDILTLAKALGNGIPIGACLVNERVNIFKPGNHGCTFGGNPLSCAVGLTVLETLGKENLLDNAAKMGALLLAKIQEIAQPWVTRGDIIDIRGKGLMLGIEFAKPCLPVRGIALEEKLLFTISQDSIIRILPPLIITSGQVGDLALRLQKTFTRYFA